jgi:hypothetical protein
MATNLEVIARAGVLSDATADVDEDGEAKMLTQAIPDPDGPGGTDPGPAREALKTDAQNAVAADEARTKRRYYVEFILRNEFLS